MFGSKKKLDMATAPWVQISMCLIITGATLITVLNLRNDLKVLQERVQPYKTEYGTSWLKSHTLYFRGLLKSDKNGKMLERILNDHLIDNDGHIMKHEIDELDHFSLMYVKNPKLTKNSEFYVN
jgi:hypothetical protein